MKKLNKFNTQYFFFIFIILLFCFLLCCCFFAIFFVGFCCCCGLVYWLCHVFCVFGVGLSFDVLAFFWIMMTIVPHVARFFMFT